MQAAYHVRYRGGVRRVLLAVVIAGCGASPPVARPVQDAWHELTSPHFTLWTDASVDRGRVLLTDFEARRTVVTRALRGANQETRHYVIAVRDAAEAKQLTGRDFNIYSIHVRNPTRQPLALMAADLAGDDWHVRHELTHLVAYGLVHHQPSWLSEGIAEFLEDADTAPGTLEVGRPPKRIVEHLRDKGMFAPSLLFKCDLRQCGQDGRFYAGSWALFSYLVATHLDGLNTYLASIDHRVKAADAWSAAFPDLVDDDKLKDALGEFTRGGNIGQLRFEIPPAAALAITVRDMPEADVLAVRALAIEEFGHDNPLAAADATAALDRDKTNVLANEVMLAITGSISLAKAKAAAAAHPTDWRAWEMARDKARMCAVVAVDLGATVPEPCQK